MKVKLLSRKKKADKETRSSRNAGTAATPSGDGGGVPPAVGGGCECEGLASGAAGDGVAASASSAAAAGDAPEATSIHATIASPQKIGGGGVCADQHQQAQVQYPETPAGKQSLGEYTAATAEVTVLDGGGHGHGHGDDDSGVGHIELKLTDTEGVGGAASSARGPRGTPSYRCNGGVQKDKSICVSPLDKRAVDDSPRPLPAPQCRTPLADANAKEEGEGGGGRHHHRQQSRSSKGSRQSSRSGDSSGVKASRRRRRRAEVKLTEQEKDEEIDRLQAENVALSEEVRKMSLQSCIVSMKHEAREHEYESVVKKLVRKGEDRNGSLNRRCTELEDQLREKDRIVEELQARLSQLESTTA